MKRLLLTIVCCSSFLFYPSINFALELTGPSGKQAVLNEQYGPISPVETLWGISSKLRPNRSVSVQQTLLAIYKTNPYIFNEGNINQLIPESVITVPTLEFIQEQTDKEAAALIAKYSRQKKVTKINKKVPSVTADKKAAQPKVNADLLAEKNKELIKNNLAGQKELELTQKKLQTLQNELDLSHEQLVLSTEENQVLKLKLQPLRDELALVNAQLESVLATQEKQQKVIDDYRAQLDAVKALPFSGDGVFNEILRWITGSLSNLLIVITSPLLLLMACFIIVQRIRAKRLLAAQEQELAESTAMLMEESGQYDTLLSDDIYNDLEPEVDFSSDDSVAQEINNDELTAPSSAIDLEENAQQVESLDSINLEDSSDAIIGIADPEETANSADDPFGIAALTEEEDFTSSVDLDDPFDVGQLSEEEDLISSVDLDDPFGIAALAEEEDLISGTDTNDVPELSAAQQADQELAAQWESQISAQSEDLQAEQNNITEIAGAAQPEIPAVDLDIAESQAEEDFALAQAVQPEIPAVDLDIAEPQAEEDFALAKAVRPEIPAVDLDIAEPQAEEDFALAQAVQPEIPAVDLDIAEPQAEEDFALAQAVQPEIPAVDLDIAEPQAEDIFASAQAVPKDVSAQSVPPKSTATDLDLAEIEALAELDGIQADSSPVEHSDDESLAQRLSDVAFNGDVPLPKVAAEQSDDFIDIETLLDSSAEENNDEPYEEIDFNLDLNNFPDVVNAEQGVDIDDDENGIAAQLDLARAYLEIDDKAGAKEILLSIADTNDSAQRTEVDKLLSRLA